MNIEGLLTEIRTDPLTRDYAGMTRDQKWTSLNTVNRNIRQVVPAKLFAKWASSNGRLEKIRALQTTGLTDAVKSAAQYIILLLNGWQGIDPDDADDVAAIQALCNATGTAGLLHNTNDRNVLSALANVPVSRLTEIGNADMPRDYFDYLLTLNNL